MIGNVWDTGKTWANLPQSEFYNGGIPSGDDF